MDLRDKGVFLTGAARGIGRAMLDVLLEKGCKVLFVDVNAVAGKAAESELQSRYGADKVIFLLCDVTDARQLEEAFQKAVCSFGSVDVCINNAGVLDERIWEQMIALNTTAHIRGSKLALEHMRRDKGGRGGVIINTVSMAGLVSAYFHPVYVATKHAMIGYTLSCATNPKMKDMGVRWGCLCPGPVDTDLIVLEENKLEDLDAFRKILDKYTMKPEVVVSAFLHLLEDEDSNGGLMTVTANEGEKYRKRLLVDVDGVSNPRFVDVRSF